MKKNRTPRGDLRKTLGDIRCPENNSRERRHVVRRRLPLFLLSRNEGRRRLTGDMFLRVIYPRFVQLI